MNKETHHWHSPNLGQEMTLNRYGSAGKPVLVFPSQEGRYFEYEDFGLTAACAPFVESGALQLICLDSVDSQSWLAHHLTPNQRAQRHNQYEAYVRQEVLPWIRSVAGDGPLLATGCSMGGYHAANFFFRHPDAADACISLSGVYDLTLFIGSAMDDDIYLHTPLSYLPQLADSWYLERYRRARIVLCVGQGDWEEPMLTQTRRMADILRDLDVPAWVDVWGRDVSHDWPWWQKQMPYFLGKLGYQA